MSSRAHRIAVLMGGWSAEREVSLVSGAECVTALRQAGFETIEIDAGRDLADQLRKAAPDVVFNALHGRWGEDGCVQGLLEVMGLPYTHSGVMASSVAMDKERAKAVFAAAGVPVMASVLADRATVEAGHPLPPPYVVKPYNEGSSVGIYIVQDQANGPAKLDDQAPDVLMVEAFAPGRELTCAVMGGPDDARALTVTDIVSNTGWYDYDAKYAAGGSTHVVPADLPKDVFEACMDYSVKCHQALGCRGVSRTDLRWDDTKGLEGLIVLETNTQPGMTPTSLVPEQAAHLGISFPELVTWMVEDASCER
ncbi:MAG: D-alanine--D-alanine ligase [Pikeienuella sp.]